MQDLKSCYYEGGDFEHCGFPRRFEHPALYLFQALGLVVIESSIASEREYSQLQARGMNGDRPRQPYLTDLGKILIHVINDIPISSFLIKQNHI